MNRPVEDAQAPSTSTGSGLDDDVRAADEAVTAARRRRRRRLWAASAIVVLAIAIGLCAVPPLTVAASRPECAVPAREASSAMAWAARVKALHKGGQRMPIVGTLWQKAASAAIEDAFTCEAAFLALADVDPRSLQGLGDKARAWLATPDVDGRVAPEAKAASAIVIDVMKSVNTPSPDVAQVLRAAVDTRVRLSREQEIGADLAAIATAVAARRDATEIAEVRGVIHEHVAPFLNGVLDAADAGAGAGGTDAVPIGVVLLQPDDIPSIYTWCRELSDRAPPSLNSRSTAAERFVSSSMWGKPAPAANAIAVCGAAGSVDPAAFTRQVEADPRRDDRRAVLDDIALLIDDEYPSRCVRLRTRTEMSLVLFPSPLDRALKAKFTELHCKTLHELVRDLERLNASGR